MVYTVAQQMDNTNRSAAGTRVMPQVVREGLPNKMRHKLHLKRKGFNSAVRQDAESMAL